MNDSKLWIKKIEPEILEAANLPLNVSEPTFPLDEFVATLVKELNIEDLSIEIGNCEWKGEETYFSGLGSSPTVLAFQASPLDGDLFFVMPQEDIVKLTHLLKDQTESPILVDHPDIVKGLYQYIIIQALDSIKTLKTYDDLAFKLVDQPNFEETSFSVDLSIKTSNEILWGRLLISPRFYQSFSNHYMVKQPSLSNLQKAKDLKLPLSVVAGSVDLTTEELKNLKQGDFIQIDNLHYHVESKKGSFKVFLQDTPIFQVKLKNDNLKILDFIYSYTENTHG